MLASHFLHQRHNKHIMVNGKVHLLKYRSQLKLVRSHLIVSCLTRYAQLKSLNLQILHKRSHTLWYSTEVVVIHLLVLSRGVTHQRTSCKQKVRTSRVQSFINKEILLFPSQIRHTLLNLRIKVMHHICGSLVNGMYSLQQRSLIVQRLTCI